MAAGETTVGGIVGFLRMDDDEFNRTIDRAIAKLEVLERKNVDVKVNTSGIERISRVSRPAADGLDSLTAASRRVTDATARVQIAQARLDEVRSRGRTSTVISAEHSLARALRDEQDAIFGTYDGNLQLTASHDQVDQSARRASRGVGALATSIITLGPALIPLAAGATGLAAGLGAMGTAGVAALLVIKKEMAAGTDLGHEYSQAIRGIQSDLLDLGHTAAAGLLGPLQDTIAGLTDKWPALNREVGEFASLAGQTAGAVLDGLVGAFITLEPLMLRAGTYILELSQRFAGLMSGDGLRGFGDYVSSVFPQVMDSIESIVSAVARLVQAFAPIGSVVLAAITGVADAINAIPVDVLTAAGVAAIALFAGFKAWAVVKSAASALARMSDAAGTFGPRMAAAAASTTLMLGVVGGVAAVLSVVTFAWMKHQQSVQASKQAVDSLTDALIRSNGAVDDTIIHDRAVEISKGKVADAARKAGVDLGDLTLASLGNADAQSRVSAALATHSDQLYTYQAAGKSAVRVESDMGKAVHSVTDFLAGSNKTLTQAQQARQDYASATASATSTTESQNLATQGLASTLGITVPTLLAAQEAQQKNADSASAATIQMQLENDAAGLLKGTLDLLNGKSLSAAEAQNAFDSSLVNMGDHVDKTGKKIKFTTTSITNMSSASVALRGQLNGQIANLQRVVEANGGLANSTGKARKQMMDLRQQIIDNAVAHGVDRKAVTAYVDSVLKIPKKVPPTKLDVDKKQADAALEALKRHLLAVTQPRTVTVTTHLVTIGSGAFSGKKVPTSATGGTVGGNGGPTADDQLTLLSSGEEVVNAKSAAKWRPLLKAINADKFAKGGTVGGWAGVDSSLTSSLGKDLGAQVVQAFADGMGGGKGTVKSVAEQIRTIVSDSAKKASDDLKSLLDEQASYAKDVGGRFSSLGDLTGDPSQGGQSFTVGADGVMRENTQSMAFTGTLSSAIAQTKDFTATIAQLAKLGARTDILQQFLDKGPESAAAAAALAGLGRAGISNVNSLQGQLVSASGSLGSLGASAVYGPRVSAARSSAADAKVLEVAVERATRGQVAELKKVTAEGRKTNAQLQRLAGELASALKGAGSGVQLAQRNKPAGR